MHIRDDRLIVGSYYSNPAGYSDTWRGCAIGCSLESIRRRLGLSWICHSLHENYEIYLGVPRVLAILEDGIYEELPASDRRVWPLRFGRAIPEFADLSGVWSALAVWMLRDMALPRVVKDEWGVVPVIERVLAGYETQWKHDKPYDAWLAAGPVWLAADTAARRTQTASIGAAAGASAAASAAAAAAAMDAVAHLHVQGVAEAVAAANGGFREHGRRPWQRIGHKLCELLAAAPCPPQE